MNYIGMRLPPSGRMGNVLFQYYFLHKIAEKCGANVFYRKFPYSKYFENFGSKNKLVTVRSFGIRDTCSEIYLNNVEVKKLTREIRNVLEEKRIIVVDPGVLGNHFFDLCDSDPGEIIKIKQKFIKSFSSIQGIKSSKNKIQVALHFRGGDFAEWNSKAVLPVDYYMNSIADIKKKFDKELEFKLYSDDSKHHVVKSLEHNLGLRVNESKNLIFDFLNIMNSDILVSSPSTFAFWGGVLGKRKYIYHSRAWLDEMDKVGDPFWCALRRSKNDYYQIHSEI